MVDAKGKLLPGVAPVAMQQGIAASKNVLRLVRGRRRTFTTFDKGSLATIRRAAAVAISVSFSSQYLMLALPIAWTAIVVVMSQGGSYIKNI